MIAIVGLLIGAFWGWRVATKADGNTADKAQYAAAFGLAFFLIAMGASVMIDRMGWFGF
jgi:hypothetical protein